MKIEERICAKMPKKALVDDALMKGVIFAAIEKAKLYGTKLIVQGKNGKIEEVSPAAMKRRLAKRK